MTQDRPQGTQGTQGTQDNSEDLLESLESLSSLGFGPALLANWRAQGMSRLLPLQRQAAFEAGLLDGTGSRGHNSLTR